MLLVLWDYMCTLEIMDVGCLIMYVYTCSLRSLKGGGEGSPSWPHVEKTLAVFFITGIPSVDNSIRVK